MNFTKTLTYWYSINKRDLPWRRTKNPYNIWLSEIIMQQTQIAQGLPYYQSFIEEFPTVFDLANTNEEAVLKLWQGLGYYSRARNLHHTAKYIANDLKGEFPDNYLELLKLKGIGDYTASAIASICFDESTAVVDGNVYRLLSRYFGIDIPINSTEGIKYFKNLAQSLLPKHDVGDYNQAVMDFGARQCKPKSPNCTICPLNIGCIAYRDNLTDKLPVKINKTKIKKKYINFVVFVSEDGNTVLEKRTENGIWKNLYQFPLIETKRRMTFEDLKSHSRIQQIPAKSEPVITLYNEKEIVHKLSHQHLYTSFWIVNVNYLSNNFISTSQINDYPVPILISRFIDDFDF